MQITQMDQLPSEEAVMTTIDQGGEKAESRLSSDDVVRQDEDQQDEARSLASGEKSEAEGEAHQVSGHPQSQPKSQQQQQSHFQDPESAIKYLVPNYLAGSLIGKKGATIKDMQVKTSCMVRIATTGMYFPGTTERAVLVAGNIDGVKRACALILHTIHAPEHNISGCAQLLSPDLAADVDVSQRMLIPLTAGGLVIGRKGANIAALLAASGARMTLGQKAEVKANERMVTVQGKLPQVVKAVEMLLDKLHEEPVLSRFSNLSVSYRGHGNNHSRSSSASGIASPSEQYQGNSGNSSTPATSSPTVTGHSSVPAAPSAGSTTDVAEAGDDPGTAPAVTTAAVTDRDGSSVAGSPARSVSTNSASPPRIRSPAPAIRGWASGQTAGRGIAAGGRFQQQKHFQQPIRQHPQLQHQLHFQQQQQQQQQQFVQHQHHMRHQPPQGHQTRHQFHPQPHHHYQQHQQYSMPPSRAPPAQHLQPQPQPQQPQQQEQQSSPPMIHMGQAVGPVMGSPDQMGAMNPMGGMISNPPALHKIGMPPFGHHPAAGAMYLPEGMPAPVGPGVARGVEGQAHRGYAPLPSVPPQLQHQHQQQMVVPLEGHVTDPVAAAVASCPLTTSVTVGVPDNMIGAILGRGGATIAELQSMSGARINVSQRDELMPGTDSRILTISGSPMATQAAQYLVSQKIQEIADRRREGHSP